MIDVTVDAPDSEATLVGRTRTNPDAFAALYDLHVGDVYTFLYRRCGSHQDAEDLTARTFHKALEALDGYEWRGVPFRAWLFRIARNALVDHYRRGRPPVSLDGLGDAGFEPLAPEDGRDFDEALARREQAAGVWEAVGALPPMQQRAITLYFAHGLSHAETGRAIGRSEPATKQLVYRAVKALRARLAIVPVCGRGTKP
jgi:RNA polymerase sigma-70 factor (ECF subfamily)